MERLLRLLNEQKELGMPDDALSRLINTILSDAQAEDDSGLLDEDELESVQAATGLPCQKLDASQEGNDAGPLSAMKRDNKRGR